MRRSITMPAIVLDGLGDFYSRSRHSAHDRNSLGPGNTLHVGPSEGGDATSGSTPLPVRRCGYKVRRSIDVVPVLHDGGGDHSRNASNRVLAETIEGNARHSIPGMSPKDGVNFDASAILFAESASPRVRRQADLVQSLSAGGGCRISNGADESRIAETVDGKVCDSITGATSAKGSASFGTSGNLRTEPSFNQVRRSVAVESPSCESVDNSSYVLESVLAPVVGDRQGQLSYAAVPTPTKGGETSSAEHFPSASTSPQAYCMTTVGSSQAAGGGIIANAGNKLLKKDLGETTTPHSGAALPSSTKYGYSAFDRLSASSKSAISEMRRNMGEISSPAKDSDNSVKVCAHMLSQAMGEAGTHTMGAVVPPLIKSGGNGDASSTSLSKSADNHELRKTAGMSPMSVGGDIGLLGNAAKGKTRPSIAGRSATAESCDSVDANGAFLLKSASHQERQTSAVELSPSAGRVKSCSAGDKLLDQDAVELRARKTSAAESSHVQRSAAALPRPTSGRPAALEELAAARSLPGTRKTSPGAAEASEAEAQEAAGRTSAPRQAAAAAGAAAELSADGSTSAATTTSAAGLVGEGGPWPAVRRGSRYVAKRQASLRLQGASTPPAATELAVAGASTYADCSAEDEGRSAEGSTELDGGDGRGHCIGGGDGGSVLAQASGETVDASPGGVPVRRGSSYAARRRLSAAGDAAFQKTGLQEALDRQTLDAAFSRLERRAVEHLSQADVPTQ